MTTERSQRLNGLQNGVIGSLAGMIEVMIQQPTIAMKNAIQQGRSITWSVPVLYRGVGVSLASIAPISAIQFAANGKFLQLLNTPNTQTNSDQVKIVCGALAGVASAALSAPAELVMTLQQNNGKSFVATVREVASTRGVTRLFRGLEVTAVRDGVWCASYLALGPVLTKNLHAWVPSVFGDVDSATTSQKASASAVGSILTGLVTVYGTQPVDTIKTVMQGEALSHPKGKAPNVFATTKRIWRENGGWRPFYRGAVFRGGRLIGAVFILGQSRIALEELFDEHELLKNAI